MRPPSPLSGAASRERGEAGRAHFQGAKPFLAAMDIVAAVARSTLKNDGL
jgi:hypothetical protein